MRRIKKYILFSVLGSLALTSLKGQMINRVDPPNWWQNMGLDTLELIVQGSHLSQDVRTSASAGRVVEVQLYGNGTLAHIKVLLGHGELPDDLGLRMGDIKIDFPLKKRRQMERERLSERDLIYLITPDRFSNGDPSNDQITGMRETGVDRSQPYARHGGDLQGIKNRLEYITKLGATAIWLNPVLENDMPRDSYHGYAITDHYRVDPRYGGNQALVELATAMKERGMKHVADVVYNHWGSEHYLFKTLADSAMVHFTEDGQVPYSNFRFSAMTDPHKVAGDSAGFQNGWFAGAMPDINQEHPVSGAYLRMATLWYVETFMVDALRCDTYAFSSPRFLKRMNQELVTCFPELYIFGEVWAYNESSQAYFAPNNIKDVPTTGNDGVTDFTLWRSIHELYSAADADQFSWNKGAGALYYRLASDLFYAQPEDLVTFLDNHDDGRFLGQHDGNRSKLRSALTLLYFLRGIPTLYYGTELGLQGHTSHGAIREDFPGFESKFQDYSKNEGDLLDLCQELGYLRRAWSGRSELKQHIPQEGWTVLERHTPDRTYLLVVNATSQHRTRTLPFKSATLVFQSGDGTAAFAPWEARIYTIEE